MNNTRRIDGRAPSQPRKFRITPDYLAHPIASALIEVGGTRCASICGASVVLQIAFRKLLAEKKIQRFPMRENVGAISVGIRGGVPLLDLCYEEDSGADVDFNVVMTESGKFIELQGTAEEVPFDREHLDRILELAQAGLAPVFEAQNKILSAYPLPQSREPFGSLGAAFSNIKLK